jgi:hypothetical protein
VAVFPPSGWLTDQVEESEVRDWFFAFQTQIAAHMEDLILTSIEDVRIHGIDLFLSIFLL